MSRIVDSVKKSLLGRESQSYQSIPNGDRHSAGETDASRDAISELEQPHKVNMFEYGVFVLLGVAMLWSWNMFMACATYFQGRFAENQFILTYFQSMILGVSTIVNLAVMIFLSHRQTSANYPYRICISLVLNCVTFTLLALSTIMFRVSAVPYLVFTLFSVFVAAASTGFSQNGVFAFVNTFGGIYTQAIMTGQGIAGVLPAIAQIISVLLVPSRTGEAGEDGASASPKSAFLYFMTATFVSGLCLSLFLVLLSRHGITIKGQAQPLFANATDSEETGAHKSVSLLLLSKKLGYPAFAIWLSFCLTMVFPVFTQSIVSTRPEGSGRAFQPDVFIPMAFLLWNVGDLSGRVACGYDRVIIRNPKMLVAVAALRALFIPLYMMCNVAGKGAAINSDLFYWLVQLGFGFTNGWVGTSAMVVAPDYVNDDEKEACGGFMGLCLVMGLATGSVMSFFV
ncbi:nucleoside transporter-domain-containing protein [Pyronema omphalodes]|nr:nucleoside transporter-domain-containing protein [Pyronema omphalodes]